MLSMIFIVNFKITRKTNMERENFKPRDKQKYEFKYERLKCEQKSKNLQIIIKITSLAVSQYREMKLR